MTDENKPKLGRPSKFSTPMSGKDRAISRRVKIELSISGISPHRWDHQTCIAILGNKKHEMYQEEAWRRLGVIKSFTPSC